MTVREAALVAMGAAWMFCILVSIATSDYSWLLFAGAGLSGGIGVARWRNGRDEQEERQP